MRRNPRKDANHSAVVKALEMVGCNVQDLAAVGEGCPDLPDAVPVEWLLGHFSPPWGRR